MKYTVGVDIGGTFTDCVAIDENGHLLSSKSLSTPDDYSEGVLSAVRNVAILAGKNMETFLSDTHLIIHGTTIAENTIVTRSGPRAGLITTKGFEDTLLIARGIGRISGLGEAEITHPTRTEKPVPLIPRHLIEGVTERVDYKGEILVGMNDRELRKAIKSLVSKGVESVGVCFLWSFKNPKNELIAEETVRHLSPKMFLTLSSDLIPVVGEYERTSTVALNAYVGPVVSKYLTVLEHRLMENGFDGVLLIIQAYGGALPPKAACTKAVGTIESGPAAGVSASKYLAWHMGFHNVIACDMGGTTFKVGVIIAGQPLYASETTTLRYHLLSPKMDVSSIGAGGGSIAWFEEATGLLKVGPNSAGAKPGPICYNLGGTEPTVTDADMLLGYIDPNFFLGGRMKLDKEKALKGFKDRLSDKLGMDVMEVAKAVYTITNSQIADLTAKTTIERGFDPRDFAIFAYGGACPIHAGAYGEELGVKAIVIPQLSPVFSAFGALTLDVVHEYSLSDPMSAPLKPEKLVENFSRLEKKSIDELSSEGFNQEKILLSRSLDLRYRGQVHVVKVPVPLGDLTFSELENVYKEFEVLYERSYGRGSGYRPAGLEATTFRLRATGIVEKPPLSHASEGQVDASPALKGRRMVYFERLKDFTLTQIYSSEDLKPGNVIEGPAVVESSMTSTIINLGQKAKLDGYYNLVITKEEK